MNLFKSFSYKDYINSIDQRVILKKSTRFKKFKIDILRYLTIIDKSWDQENFLKFIRTLVYTRVFKRYPFSEKVAVFAYKIRGCRFMPQGKFFDKIHRCACGSMSIVASPQFGYRRQERLKPFLEIKPDCFNDNIAVYLMINRACCPECRIMGYLNDVDTRNFYMKSRTNFKDRDAYLFAYYTDLCKLAYENCLKMYEGYQFWDDNTVLPGQKFDTYIDIFWKTYVFTVVLAYRLTSSETKKGKYGADAGLSGIGFDWYNFDINYEDINAMTDELNKYLDVLMRCYGIFLRQAKKDKDKPKTENELRDLEYDYTMSNAFVEFLLLQEEYEAKVLAIGIGKVGFNPFVEFQRYLNYKKDEKKYERNHIEKTYKKQLINIWDELRGKEAELVSKGYRKIEDAWEDIKKRL